MKLNLLVTLLTLVLGSFLTYAQEEVEITVIDQQTEESLAFVKVTKNKNETKLTDIDGIVKIELNRGDELSLRFFGYKDTSFVIQEVKNTTLRLAAKETQVFDEVVVTPGKNRAHRIIRNAMDKRKDNDPMRNNSFQYESFAKFQINAESNKPISRDTVTDTILLDQLKTFEEQYLFLTETAATRIFNPPSYDQEIVKSYKVSGINNPMFATLVNQMQSFSFYDNIFKINDKDFINPIAPGGIRRYLFVLEDTLLSENSMDSTFVIKFRPRRGKNFEGLKGYLYITTNQWAIERVIAEPYEKSAFHLKVIQEYKFTANQKWFPYKLSTEFEIPELMLGKYHYMAGKSNLYISNVEFDVPVKKRFNAVRLQVEEGAANDTINLEKSRGRKFSDKEKRTYDVWDTIAEDMNLERMIAAISILSTGKIPYKKVSFPINRILSFNQQEGYRLGLGIETNNRLSQHFNIGGYFAYGFRDQSWKWGGHSSVLLNKKNQIKLNFLYQDDLLERGGVDYRKDEFDLTSGSELRQFFVNNLDRERKASVGISGLITQNFKVQLLGNYKRISYFDDYRFSPLENPDFAEMNQFDLAETGVIVSWNMFEKVMLLEDRRVSLGTPYPKITFKGIKGFDNVLDGQFDYYRFNLTVDQDFSIRGFGKLKLQSTSGQTVGNVPLILNQMPFGTGINWSVSVPNTFETVQPTEFYADRYTAFFTRFTFLPLKNNTDWTEPLISLHHGIGFGDFENRNAHLNTDFSVPHKGLYEGGIIIDNILMSGFSGIGFGVFHRYGHYASPDIADNFVYKFSIRFNL